MAKINKHIEIVRAGSGRYVSMGQKSCLMIQAVLVKHYKTVGVTVVNSELDLQAVASLKPDLVFLGLKRTSPAIQAVDYNPDNDDIWVSEYFADRGINYTGSNQAAIALDLNKNLAKQTVQQAGLATAAYFMATPGQYAAAANLPAAFPLFIKPPTQGGGKGIGADSVVRNFAEYEQKIRQIYERFATPALVETYLEGREFSVALLGSDDEVIAMPIELIAQQNGQGDRILSAQVKSADTERSIAVADGPVRTHLLQFAEAIYQELGVRDYGRIDIRMDAHGTPHFLEANLVPGISNHGYFSRACKLNQDLDYEAMILKIVDLSLHRNTIEETVDTAFDYQVPVFPALIPAKA